MLGTVVMVMSAGRCGGSVGGGRGGGGGGMGCGDVNGNGGGFGRLLRSDGCRRTAQSHRTRSQHTVTAHSHGTFHEAPCADEQLLLLEHALDALKPEIGYAIGVHATI